MRFQARILTVLLLAAAASGASAASRLDPMIKRLRTAGRPSSLPAGVAKALGIPSSAPTRREEAGPAEAEDGYGRSSELVLDSPQPTARAVAVILFARHDNRKAGTSEHVFLVLSPSGNLVKALGGHGRIDKDGRPVPHTGTAEVQHIDSPEIAKVLQRELDFWLKGKLRKKKASAG